MQNVIIAILISTTTISAFLNEKILSFRRGEVQLFDETGFSNPESFDYDVTSEDKQTDQPEFGDIYDENTGPLPPYMLHRYGEDVGWVHVPTITRQGKTWATTPSADALQDDRSWGFTTPMPPEQTQSVDDYDREEEQRLRHDSADDNLFGWKKHGETTEEPIRTTRPPAKIQWLLPTTTTTQAPLPETTQSPVQDIPRETTTLFPPLPPTDEFLNAQASFVQPVAFTEPPFDAVTERVLFTQEPSNRFETFTQIPTTVFVNHKDTFELPLTTFAPETETETATQPETSTFEATEMSSTTIPESSTTTTQPEATITTEPHTTRTYIRHRLLRPNQPPSPFRQYIEKLKAAAHRNHASDSSATVPPRPVVIRPPGYRGPTFNCRVLNPYTDGVASSQHDPTCPMIHPGLSLDNTCSCYYLVSGRDSDGCATGFKYACRRRQNHSIAV